MKDILKRVFLIVFNIVKSLFSLYTYFLEQTPRMTIAFTIYVIIRLLF